METSPLQKSKRKQNQWPVASNILWRRTSIAASTTNPHWHMQPLTVVYGESGPPVSMQRITMAWHSLWINCACWHAPLTVSNSACDLCTAAPNILLEWGHKSAERCLTLYAIIHTPCFNCPIWRWCKHEQTLPLLAFAAPSLLISRPHSHTNAARPHEPRANQYGCMRRRVRAGSAVEAGAAEENGNACDDWPIEAEDPSRWNKFTPTHTVHVLYAVCVTPILHTVTYKSLNAALKAISPPRNPAEKSLELELNWGLPASRDLTQQPKVFRVSLQWLTNLTKPYFRDHLDWSGGPECWCRPFLRSDVSISRDRPEPLISQCEWGCWFLANLYSFMVPRLSQKAAGVSCRNRSLLKWDGTMLMTPNQASDKIPRREGTASNAHKTSEDLNLNQHRHVIRLDKARELL